MSTYDLLADLPLEIESYELEAIEREVSSDFTRLSTVVRLRGRGHEGVGEDVTYEALDHVAFQDAGPALPLAGSHTVESFSRSIEELDLWPSPPVREPSRDYRRWAFESSALDLALEQAGRSLADVLGRDPQPVTFVVSLRLGDPPTIDPIRRRLDRYPSLRFKLDPTSDWDDELIAAVAATGAVDSVDFKGAYEGRSSTSPRIRASTGRWSRPFRTPGSRTPSCAPKPTAYCTTTAIASPGTRSSTRSRTSTRCRFRRRWST